VEIGGWFVGCGGGGGGVKGVFAEMVSIRANKNSK